MRWQSEANIHGELRSAELRSDHVLVIDGKVHVCIQLVSAGRQGLREALGQKRRNVTGVTFWSFCPRAVGSTPRVDGGSGNISGFSL